MHKVHWAVLITLKVISVKTVIIFIGRKYGYYCIVMKMSHWLNYSLLAYLRDFPLVLDTHRNPRRKITFYFCILFYLCFWLGFYDNLNRPSPTEKLVLMKKKMMNPLYWKNLVPLTEERKKVLKMDEHPFLKGESIFLKYEAFSICKRNRCNRIIVVYLWKKNWNRWWSFFSDKILCRSNKKSDKFSTDIL